MKSRLLLALLSLVLVPITSHAQWIFNGKPVSTAANTQTSPAAVSDGAGGAIITWQDARLFVFHIYAQRIDAAGNVKWTTDGVAICSAINGQYNPRIVSDGAGGAIIGWVDNRAGNSDIYAQRVNASGAVQWTVDGVAVCTAAQTQTAMSMVADGAGGAILTWGDIRSIITEDIYAQRLNSLGVAQWTANGVLVCGAAGNQDLPGIVTDGAVGAVIAWQDNRLGTNDIYAQRVNSAGVAQWTANGLAVCTAANSQANLAIASDGAGGAVMAWEDFRSGSNMDIYVQRFNSTGASLLPGDGVAACANASDQYGPQVVWDTTGASIAWYDYRSGSGDVYAQRFSPTGNPQWTQDGQAVCTAINGQVTQSMVSDGSGGIVMAWQDARNTTLDVFAQRMDASGLGIWNPDGVPLCQPPQRKWGLLRSLPMEPVASWRHGSTVAREAMTSMPNTSRAATDTGAVPIRCSSRRRMCPPTTAARCVSSGTEASATSSISSSSRTTPSGARSTRPRLPPRRRPACRS
jgi:hypothetical protein